MPVILPTPDEIAAMPWHSRDRAVNAARALLRGYGDLVEPSEPTRWRSRRDGYRSRHAAWAEGVRAEARRLVGER